jgi:hypothetical protein
MITRAAKRILEDLPTQQIRMNVTGIGMVKVVCGNKSRKRRPELGGVGGRARN